MEMTQEMIDKYGQENMKALAEYKAKYLPQGTETKLPNEPKDIPVGTILTQYWLNSMTYYMVTRTTKKCVEFVDIFDTQVGFDHDGGGTGTRYCMPDFVKTFERKGCPKKILKVTKPAKGGGFYIPGVHSGFMCGPMRLWDGTPDSEYYGD